METKKNDLQKTVLAMVLINAFTTPLMLSAVHVALPELAEELELNAILLGWVPMGYLMASAIFIIVFGRLADLYGRKKIFLLGTICIVISSLVAALSVNGPMLIIARFLQGASAAMLYATQIAIISSVFPPQKRGRMIGLGTSMTYLGLTGGPLIGGVVTDLLGWRASLILHLPFSLLALFIGFFKIPSGTDWLENAAGRFDKKGGLLYGFSIILLCIGISLLPQLPSYSLIIGGIMLFIYFFRYTHTARYPIMNVDLFYKSRIFTCSCLAALLMYTATYANIVLISLYLQYIKVLSATLAGLVIMVQPFAAALVAPFAGRLSDKIEPYWIASIGVSLIACGLFMLSLLGEEGGANWFIISALFLSGAGIGFFTSPNTNAILSTVDKSHYGSITSSVAGMRIVGQMSSMVLVTMIFALVVGAVQLKVHDYGMLAVAIRINFSIAVVLCIPAFLLSLVRGRMH